MFHDELSSFLPKFHQQRLDGQTVPVHHKQNTRRRSQSYYKRQKGRKTAQTKFDIESDQINNLLV